MSELYIIEFDATRAQKIKEKNLWQFLESTNLNNVIDIINEIADEDQAAFVDISKGWLLNEAEGVQLDYLGNIELGIERGSFTDEEYKLFLLLISKYRNTSTTRDSIVEAVKIISGQEDPDIYIGNYKNLDVTFFADCKSSLVVGKELPRLFPILTTLRLLAKKGPPFGMAGANNKGFGTTTGDNILAGGFVSLV